MDFHIWKYKGDVIQNEKVIFVFRMHRFGKGILSKVNFIFILE